MNQHYANALQTIPGRDSKPRMDIATAIRCTERSIEALRAAGLPTASYEAKLAELKAREVAA